MLIHAIRFIFRSGGTGKTDVTSEDRERSMSSRYQNIDVWCHWLMQNAFMMYKPCNKSVYIYIYIYIYICHRAMDIIYMCLTLTPNGSERPITSKSQILMSMNANGTNTTATVATVVHNSVHMCATCCREDATLYCTGCKTS